MSSSRDQGINSINKLSKNISSRVLYENGIRTDQALSRLTDNDIQVMFDGIHKNATNKALKYRNEAQERLSNHEHDPPFLSSIFCVPLISIGECIETLRKVHANEKDYISIIQSFEKMLLAHYDIEDVDRTGLTISRTNDASTFQSKDASQPILEESRLEGPIKIGLADVKVDGFQAAKDVSCVLHKMTMSNQLRAVNSFRYPAFNQESNMYEIIVKGDKGSRFEEEKEIINSNDVMIKNSRTVKINFEDVIHDGQVEYAVGGGHIVDTVGEKEIRDFFPLICIGRLRYAVVTAAHVCTEHELRLTSDCIASYHYQHDSINGKDIQDYAVVDIIPSYNVNPFTVRRIPVTAFMDNNNDNAVIMGGKITEVGWGDFRDFDTNFSFCRRFCHPPQIFFIGQYSKRWGYVSNDGFPNMYKRNMIQCDLKLKKGDSGGLLFFEGGVPGEFTALGILSMIHGDVSFFTSLSECFDHDLFELP